MVVFLAGDGADVAEDVGEEGAGGVGAAGGGFDLEAGDFALQAGDAEGEFFVGVGFEDDGEEGVDAAAAFEDVGFDVVGGEAEEGAEAEGDGVGGGVGDVGGDDGDGEGGDVFDEGGAVAVEDEAADGGGVGGADAVDGGAGFELVVAEDLEADELDGEDAEEDEDEDAEQADLGADMAGVWGGGGGEADGGAGGTQQAHARLRAGRNGVPAP